MADRDDARLPAAWTPPGGGRPVWSGRGPPGGARCCGIAVRRTRRRSGDATGDRCGSECPSCADRSIHRYAAEDLVLAVFDDLSAQLAEAVLEHPLSGQGFGSDTVMGKWVRIASVLVIAGQPIAGRGGFNPVLAMAETLRVGYGLDSDASRSTCRRRSLQRRSGGASSRRTSFQPVSSTWYRPRRCARNWFAPPGVSAPPHGHRHLIRCRARSETTVAPGDLRLCFMCAGPNNVFNWTKGWSRQR